MSHPSSTLLPRAPCHLADCHLQPDSHEAICVGKYLLSLVSTRIITRVGVASMRLACMLDGLSHMGSLAWDDQLVDLCVPTADLRDLLASLMTVICSPSFDCALCSMGRLSLCLASSTLLPHLVSENETEVSVATWSTAVTWAWMVGSRSRRI